MAPWHTNPNHVDHRQMAPQIAYRAIAQMQVVRLDLDQSQLIFHRHQYLTLRDLHFTWRLRTDS